MRKAILIVGIICLMLVILTCGCTNKNSGNAITMTAEEMMNDMTMDMSGDTVTIGYGSLEEGDTLIIQDTVGKITYDSSTDSTTVEFSSAEQTASGGTSSSTLNFYFQGDITDSYQVGDEVKITGKIKHVSFSFEHLGSTFNYDMELLEDQWDSEDYFTTNMIDSGNPYKPMPTTAIQKV